jgi:hypothetical protein
MSGMKSIDEIPTPAESLKVILEDRAKMRWIVWDDGDFGTEPQDGTDFSSHIANSWGRQTEFLVETHNNLLDENDKLRKRLAKAEEALKQALKL